MSLQVRPITLRAAQAFVDEHHRHNKAPRGHKLSISVVDATGTVVGVATVSRPVARALDTGINAEVTRVCTLGNPNACSMLYGAAARICKAMGYHKVFTYTQGEETGASLRGAGWILDARLPARPSWADSSVLLRSVRDANYQTGGVERARWSVTFAGNA
jgi:hypothetical protein